MYHGSNHDFTKFNYTFLGAGTEQEGTGFYLTSSKEDAHRYGKFIHTVEVNYRKVVPMKGKKNVDDVRFLIQKAPDLKMTLTNFDENPKVALEKAVKAMVEYSKNPHDMYLSVWSDFYKDNPKDYLKNMVRLGYDGVIIKKQYGVTHFIAFDPDKLRIVK